MTHGVVTGIPAETEHSTAAKVDGTRQQWVTPSGSVESVEVGVGIDGDDQSFARSFTSPGPELFRDRFGLGQGEVEPSSWAVSAGVLRNTNAAELL